MTEARKSSEMYGVVLASKIIGRMVVNCEYEDLGEIRELVMDAKEGCIAYAVLSFGGFMGLGNKLFAIPWSAFEFAEPEERLTGFDEPATKLMLNVDKEKLKEAPGFDQDAKWPDFADRTWGNGIYKYYGCAPYWKP
jgi:hypothetical protein